MRSSYINPGDKVSINVKVSGDPGRSYMSYIDTLVDEQTPLIYAPIPKGQMIRLSTFEDYEFVLYVQIGLYRTNGKAPASFMEDNVATVKIQIGRLELTQRREFYRVITTLEFTYTRSMLGVDEIGDLPLHPATGENISGGGMCFLSSTLLSEGEPTHCTLPIKNQMITIEVIVLYTESPEDSRELYRMYEHRARSYSREKRDQKAVMQYVFAKQHETLFRRKMQFEAVDSDDENQGILRR